MLRTFVICTAGERVCDVLGAVHKIVSAHRAVLCPTPSMLEYTGEMVQEKLTGQTAIEQLTSGHISPFGDGQGFF